MPPLLPLPPLPPLLIRAVLHVGWVEALRTPSENPQGNPTNPPNVGLACASPLRVYVPQPNLLKALVRYATLTHPTYMFKNQYRQSVGAQGLAPLQRLLGRLLTLAIVIQIL